MPCFYPVHGFEKEGGGFTMKPQLARAPLTVPCGQCLGCRLAKSQDWATRLMHEKQLHEAVSFLTLTFRDESLPEDYSVNVRDTQLFMKRLRKQVPAKLRFFACGEYGESTLRPHYHFLIFGFDFPDRYFWRNSPTGHPLYRSDLLEKVWPFGHAEIGQVTSESVAYCARYMLKKVNGQMAREHYLRVHPLTGELNRVEPEFIRMSNRPGIGSDWFDQFASDAFPEDFVVIEGQKRPVPLYYKRKLAKDEQEIVSLNRAERARKNEANNTPERLAVREKVTALRVEKLKREL